MEENDKLEVVDLYASSNQDKIKKFKSRTESKLRVVTDLDKVDSDYEWLSMMEDTIMYLDNILRNPNRFIINEEEIVKIEKAKRVTVESIKHLSHNTNLIQSIDKKTGDVKPSKILNINKEENFNTYENRFIYTLIQNMKFFISQKTKGLITDSTYKNVKKFEYTGIASVGKQKIDINVALNSGINDSKPILDADGRDIPTRIERLNLKISDLTQKEVYKTLARLHVALVTSPIRKTNLVLKNVNFQYAVKLWNYLQSHTGAEGEVNEKKKKDYYDNGKLKKYMDDSFLLDYLTMEAVDAEDNGVSESEKEEITERLIGNVVEKIMDINQSMSEEQLKDIVAKQFTVIKYKNIVTDRKIAAIYKDSINKYLDKIKKIKFKGDDDDEEEEVESNVESNPSIEGESDIQDTENNV